MKPQTKELAVKSYGTGYTMGIEYRRRLIAWIRRLFGRKVDDR